jgi:YidC/Oxa1 family membrane protein insertase
MERRALLAVVISLVILLGYEQVMRRLYPAAPTGEPAPSAPADDAPPVAPAAPAAAPQPEEARPREAAVPERLVTVDTPLYTATFSSNGARLISFRLHKYRTTVKPDSPPQELIIPGPAGEAPIGVELRGGQGLPVISDAAAPYRADHDQLVLTDGAPATLSFTWSSAEVTVRKRLTFRPDSYHVSAEIELSQVPAGYNELMLSWSKLADPAHKPGVETVFDKVVFLNGKKRNEHTFASLEKGEIVEGDIRWTGYAGLYFFAGMALQEAHQERLWLKLRGPTVEQKLLIPVVAGNSARVGADLFIGPKDVDALEVAGHGFERALDLGWFSFIALPLLYALELSHRLTGNYGIDIILLTVIIKILFIPLTHKSFQSMQAMQKLQPQMQKIREKMKDKPEEMNKEIMELYRRHKVNPLGGCLPMLLQIPVFIGLYSALSSAIELRHAPFMLWVNDLAAPDRLGTFAIPFIEPPGIPVLTLLMGASMFVQQWMTPTMGDPAQRQIMMLMPLMFTFMFVGVPSGLSLYWLINNVLTIAQQYFMVRAQPKPGG